MKHNHFKLFIESFSDNSFDQTKVNEFINSSGVTPRSVGVEFLESNKSVIISIGYSTEKTIDDRNKTSLKLKQIGKLDGDIEAKLSTIESSMVAASNDLGGIICHEFFVDHDANVFSLFLHEVG